MQPCSFSETQFVMQYVFEHYNKFPISPFPFFPDTVAEGKYYGFDVCIGSFFYQFKISPYYEFTDNTRGVDYQKYWNLFGVPYYLKSISTSSKQFKLLKRISNIPQYAETVFYVMPEFHTRDKLKRFYTLKEIISNSARFL